MLETRVVDRGRALRPVALALVLAASGCLRLYADPSAPTGGDGGPAVGAVPDGGDAGIVVQDFGDGGEPTGAAALVGETFPGPLLQPYAGPPSDYYDDTFIRYPQLEQKVRVVFNDTWVRGGVDQFAARITLFGGVDFAGNVNEARTATPDFLLALDDLAKDVCAQATTQKTGPFAAIDPTAIGAATVEMSKIDQLYQAMLFRPSTATEQSDGVSLLADLVTAGSTPADAWAGLCEGLVHHQDFLFTLAPSFATLTGADRTKLLLVRVAQDLLGRPPQPAELNELSSGQKSFSNLVDDYLASTEFRDWYFYRMRVKTQSVGTTDSDEPARLWTYLAIAGAPFSDLFAADYTVDATFAKIPRDATHGKTGILTMPGFIAGKPGLPHFTYAARVLGDYMGVTFEVPPSVVAMRVGATAATTVVPGSLCYTCHQMLTPLAYQRQRWMDDGTYSTTDSHGQTIDDSDQSLVASYPFKGAGIEAFATQAIKKEAFIRRMLDAQYLLTVGRSMRAWEDERTVYKQLWDLSASASGNLKTILKAIILSPVYQGI